MHKFNNLLYFFIIGAAFLAFACEKAPQRFTCTDSIGCVHIPPDEPLRLGVLQSVTGKVAALGTDQIRGIELATAKMDGHFMGHPIVLQKEDPECSKEGGANAALRIVADPRVVAVLGTTCSGSAATAAEVISEAGLLMISGNNSAPFLTSVGGKQGEKWQAGYFRTSNNEDASGGAAATFAYKELGVRRVATINDGDIYTRGLTDGFKKVFEELGGKIALYGVINKGDIDMLPLLTAVRDTRAELLFFPLFQSEGNQVVLQAKKVSGMEQVILMSGGALILSTFIEAVGEKGKGMYFVGPTPGEGPASEALAAEYEAKYKARPLTSYYQNAYDAACLLFNALEKTAIQDADGTLHIGRQALRDALYGTRDFKGVVGRLSCDRFGDCAFPRFNILRLDDPSAGLSGLQSNVMYTHTPGRSAEEE